MIKRTRKLFASLRDNLAPIFGPSTTGFTVTTFPNGIAHDVWVQSKDGRLGFSVHIGEGPYGLSVDVRSFDSRRFSVSSDDPSDPTGYASRREVHATLYRDTAEAEAFRRWYHHEETSADVALLGPDYARKAATS